MQEQLVAEQRRAEYVAKLSDEERAKSATLARELAAVKAEQVFTGGVCVCTVDNILYFCLR